MADNSLSEGVQLLTTTLFILACLFDALFLFLAALALPLIKLAPRSSPLRQVPDAGLLLLVLAIPVGMCAYAHVRRSRSRSGMVGEQQSAYESYEGSADDGTSSTPHVAMAALHSGPREQRTPEGQHLLGGP